MTDERLAEIESGALDYEMATAHVRELIAEVRRLRGIALTVEPPSLSEWLANNVQRATQGYTNEERLLVLASSFSMTRADGVALARHILGLFGEA